MAKKVLRAWTGWPLRAAGAERWPAISRKVDQDGEGVEAAKVPEGRPRTSTVAYGAVMKSLALRSQSVCAS